MATPRITRKTPRNLGRMFVPVPQTVAPAQAITPAGMFMGPLANRAAMLQSAQHPAFRDSSGDAGAMAPNSRPAWADLASGIGMGLLTGRNLGEGLALGLNYAQQYGDVSNERARLARRDAAEEEDREIRKDALRMQHDDRVRQEAERTKRQTFYDQTLAPFLDDDPSNDTPGITLSRAHAQMLQGLGADAGYQALAGMFTPKEPQSAYAKMQADVDAGLVPQSALDQWWANETRPPQGPQAPETWEQVTINGQPMLQSSRGDLKAIPGQDEGGYGNSLDARMLNILMTGDPASQEYAMAYAHTSQPKATIDPVSGSLVMQTPNLDWARKPTYGGGGVTSPAQLPILPEGSPRVGPTVQSAQAGNSAESLPGAQTITTDGAKITTAPGSGMSAGDRSKIRSVRAESDAIKNALARFKEVVKETGVAERMSAVAGGMTEGGRKLNSAWTNAAIMTKAEALFNLGVLNGPDLSVIQGTLPNPATMNGAMTSDEAYNAAIDEVTSLIDSKVKAFEAQYGDNPEAPPSPSDGGKVVEWERGSDGVLRPKGPSR